MTTALYALGCTAIRGVCTLNLHTRVLHPERLRDRSLKLLAVTHLSHLEPMIVSSVMPRPVHWMARIEFYRNPVAAAALKCALAFPVNRQGVPVSTIRRSIALVHSGRVVGVFPEGGVATGPDSILRGGRCKGGVCLIAQHTGSPILPIAVIGTHRLNRVRPWIPIGREPLYVGVGRPLEPAQPGSASRCARREARQQMTRHLRDRFTELFSEMQAAFDIPDSDVP